MNIHHAESTYLYHLVLLDRNFDPFSHEGITQATIKNRDDIHSEKKSVIVMGDILNQNIQSESINQSTFQFQSLIHIHCPLMQEY